MKKTAILLTTICASAFLYVSCSSNDTDNTPPSTDLTNVGASIAVDTSNEMDLNTGLLVTSSSNTGKTTETPAGICAAISVTTPNGGEYPKVFTVDFGTTGCKDENNLTRKGKLKITLSGSVITTGSKMTIERIDYSINNIKLEGTIEYTNTTTVATIPQWTRKVTNGKLTDLKGGVYTNSGTYTTRQIAGVDTPFVLSDNVYEITDGSHTVTASNGTTLTLTVKETLVKKYSCLFISKGQLKIQGGILNGVIDYGNNDCDALYTYTHENGTSYSLSM
ncbi:hypothetical protein [Flavobacterium sp. SORGH_AS_0622]|uniref:hypothetical protein n=1 Tax=Flavobacterium sp. SORGH_AS_0622 TaxID=3041772 RepID=UPI00277F4325|nr:hypothetical protein [Flavobacterium sp. SORGH_AS_0622]MDQ1167444.1 hypothetical protein [Flavobacterium sp. SORGH_AS_0622]